MSAILPGASATNGKYHIQEGEFLAAQNKRAIPSALVGAPPELFPFSLLCLGGGNLYPAGCLNTEISARRKQLEDPTAFIERGILSGLVQGLLTV